MRICFKRIFCGLALFIGCQITYAITVSNLYKMSIPVSSESVAQRHKAFVTGLRQVFIKVSGNSQVVSISAIKAAIQSADDYVQQYSYAKPEQSQQATTPLLLNVDYSATAIKQLLRQNNQPIWGNNRPVMLVWLVVDNNQGSNILGSGASSPILKNLVKDAEQRGLPIELPMMDLTDLQNINVNAIKQNNVLAIENASQRYLANAILAVTINTEENNSLTSQWTLLFQNKQQQWQEQAGTIEQIINQGINQATDQIASQYAVTESNQSSQQVQIQVNNLGSLADFAKLQNYLNGLTGVSHLQVLSLTNDKAVFDLTLNSSVEALEKQIQLDHRLSSVNQYGNDEVQSSQGLVYQYNAYQD